MEASGPRVEPQTSQRYFLEVNDVPVHGSVVSNDALLLFRDADLASFSVFLLASPLSS